MADEQKTEIVPAAPTEAQLVAAAHVAVMHLHNQAMLASQLSDPVALSAAKTTVKALRDTANKACDAAGM